jgi:putative transposase
LGRLGIELERIKPGHPQQNGRHERMHVTLTNEATKPASQNFLQQSAAAARVVGSVVDDRFGVSHESAAQAGASIRLM